MKIGLVSAFTLGTLFTPLHAAAEMSSNLLNAISDGSFITMSDEQFATEFADAALSDNIEDRSTVAYMLFSRINQQIPVDRDGDGQTDGDTAPLWLDWASDSDVFRYAEKEVCGEPAATEPCFVYNRVADGQVHFVLPKDELADEIPDSEETIRSTLLASSFDETHGTGTKLTFRANESAYRNQVGFDYIAGKKTGVPLHSRKSLAAFFSNKYARLEMPIGSIEVKAAWVHKNSGVDGSEFTKWENYSDAYKVTLTNTRKPETSIIKPDDTGDDYAFAGMHIGMKMAPTPSDQLNSTEPSWFWTTFEFNDVNPRVTQARAYITYGDKAKSKTIDDIYRASKLTGTPFAKFSTNGTQLAFQTKSGSPIILGNSLMEDFAFEPDGKSTKAENVTGFDSSCHTCHATANINTTLAFDGTNLAGNVPLDGNFVETGAVRDEVKDILNVDVMNLTDFVWSFMFAQ